MIRYATVKNAHSIREARAYLPSNYEVVWEYEEDGKPVFVIEGTDDHGWGLDTYVIPRYASGVIWANEIEQPVCALCGMSVNYHGADMHSFAPRPAPEPARRHVSGHLRDGRWVNAYGREPVR